MDFAYWVFWKLTMGSNDSQKYQLFFFNNKTTKPQKGLVRPLSHYFSFSFLALILKPDLVFSHVIIEQSHVPVFPRMCGSHPILKMSHVW